MESKKRCCCGGKKKTATQDKPAEAYPGTAVDIADDEKVTPEMVKQQTKILDNNPRNND